MSSKETIRAGVISLILLGFFEAVYFKQEFFWVITFPIAITFILVFVWIFGPDLIRRKSLKMKKIILPFLLLFGIVFFLLFEPSGFLRQMVIIFGIAAFILFFVIYRRLPLERPKDPQNILVYNGLFFLLNLTAFLDFWVIFSIYFNFGLPLWMGMIFILVAALALFYYLFWACGIFADYILPFTVLLGVVILEVFVSLSFWPVNFATKSIILILVFYLFSGLLILRAKKELTKKEIAEYLILFIIIFLIIIFTMNWYTVF